MVVDLVRFASDKRGTLGWIFVNKRFVCYSLERPWANNEVDISCICNGVYPLKPDNFQGRYDNYQLQNVPGRTVVEVHIGNYIQNSKGCILTGTSFEQQSNQFVVWNSRAAFEALMRRLNRPRGGTHTLEIHDLTGVPMDYPEIAGRLA